MFGKNERLKQINEYTWNGMFSVKEVFPTLQGEGPFSGRRAVFVRLGGCNLACFWCDTDFDEAKSEPHTSDDILKRVRDVAPWPGGYPGLVVITGGEPMRQPIGELCTALLEQGYTVQIETSGTLWTDLPEHSGLHIVVSPKTKVVHDQIRKRALHWKYVISSGDTHMVDGLPIYSTQKPDDTLCTLARPPKGVAVYVSPLDVKGSKDINTQTCLEVAMKHGYTLSLQIHKLLGVP
jgi:7-carboxy-7-deazaguanine synthase